MRRGNGDFTALKITEEARNLPQASANRIAFWFGRVKKFPHAKQLTALARDGVPITLAKSLPETQVRANLRKAMSYQNHRSILPHRHAVVDKIYEDVRQGRAYVFPKAFAEELKGLWISPMGAVVSGTEAKPKLRIVHDFSFDHGGDMASVNSVTDFESAPKVQLKHILRNFAWRILYLRHKAPRGRILLSSMDVAQAYRQVVMSWGNGTMFGYPFGDWIVVDRRLPFGWVNSAGYFCLFSAALKHSHTNTTMANAVVSRAGKQAISHVTVSAPRKGERPQRLPRGCRVPPGQGGGREDPFSSDYYIDDAMLAEIQYFDDGRRCLASSGALASDHSRLFGERTPRDPPILAAKKISNWDTELEVLGWTFDTVAMTISLPESKLHSYSQMLAEWPPTRRSAPTKQVLSLLGKLIHAATVLRPGRFFVTRLLNQLGLSLAGIDESERKFGKGTRPNRAVIFLGADFHSDIQWWSAWFRGALKNGRHMLSTPLYTFVLQPPYRHLLSDASGIAMGGYCWETKRFWRYSLTDEQNARLVESAQESDTPRDALTINLLELLGMAITAYAFIADGNQPRHERDAILLRGDNMSAVHWLNQCRGGRDPRSGAIMRVMGGLEVGSGWCFRAKHIKGVDNTLADGISRWKDPSSIVADLRRIYPDANWSEQVLTPVGLQLITGVLDRSTSADQLRRRLDGLMSLSPVLGKFFVSK